MAVNSNKSRKDLLTKGLILCFLGAVVLLAPRFINAPGFNQAVGGSSVVGWFSLVIGIALLGQWALRRSRD